MSIALATGAIVAVTARRQVEMFLRRYLSLLVVLPGILLTMTGAAITLFGSPAMALSTGNPLWLLGVLLTPLCFMAMDAVLMLGMSIEG